MSDNEKIEMALKSLQTLVENNDQGLDDDFPVGKYSLEDFIDWLIDWLLHPEYQRTFQMNPRKKKRLAKAVSFIVSNKGSDKPKTLSDEEKWLLLLLYLIGIL